MRVLLVNPKPQKYYKSSTCPLGLLSIAAYLNQRNHSVEIADSAVKNTGYKKKIKEYKPDIVGVSVISYKSITDAIKVSQTARAENIPVVWGGPLASIIPETVLAHGCVDYVIIGEGEITFEILLEALTGKTSLDQIDGLAYVEQGKIRINKDRAFADLAEFPIIDWSLVNPSDYFQSLFSVKKMLYLYSAKGCPGRCTFCFNKSFNKCVYRKRPFEYCIEEIKYLTANSGLDGVHFADELWCRNKKEMVENCEKLMNTGLSVLWGCNARIGTYEKEDYEYLFRAGCRWIFFGVESGSEAIQDEIEKGISLAKVEETINSCAAAGIVPVTSFIIGFPDETAEQINETIALAKKIPSAMYDFNFYFPLTGSEMCDKLVEQGRYIIPDTLEEFSKLIPTEKMQINFSKIPTRELKVIRAFFMWSSLTRRDSAPHSGKRLFMKKAVADAVKGLFGRGIKNFAGSFIYDAQTFFSMVATLAFHPRIRRRFGLCRNGKQQPEQR
jgi:anaerobic magnesium-protoporphyrin IX monomethyl ester cyclase